MHADLFRKKSEYASPTLADIIVATQDEESDKRIIPVPESVTPAALDYYLCKLYGVKTSYDPDWDPYNDDSVEQRREKVAMYMSVAELYRWAQVHSSLYKDLDECLERRCWQIWNGWGGKTPIGRDLNNEAFELINAIEDFSDVLPCSYGRCLNETWKVLSGNFLTLQGDRDDMTFRLSGMPLLLASSESLKLSTKTWRALMYSVMNGIRAPFNGDNFGSRSRAQVTKVDEMTYMSRFETYMNDDNSRYKYRPFVYQLKTYRISFKSKKSTAEEKKKKEPGQEEGEQLDSEVIDDGGGAGPSVDATAQKDKKAVPWQELVSISDPDMLGDHSGNKLERHINVVLEARVLVIPGTYKEEGTNMLVRVGAPKYARRKRPRPDERPPPDLGKISDVQVSFPFEGAKYSSPVTNDCLTGGFSGALHRYPPNTTDEEKQSLDPILIGEVFRVPCTREFLEAARRVDNKDIQIDLLVEVSYD